MDQTEIAKFLASHQWIIIIAILWILPWKGAALWKAARNQSVAWFTVIFLINTLGILEILYIFLFSKKKKLPDDIIPEKNSVGEK